MYTVQYTCCMMYIVFTVYSHSSVLTLSSTQAFHCRCKWWSVQYPQYATHSSLCISPTFKCKLFCSGFKRYFFCFLSHSPLWSMTAQSKKWGVPPLWVCFSFYRAMRKRQPQYIFNWWLWREWRIMYEREGASARSVKQPLKWVD